MSREMRQLCRVADPGVVQPDPDVVYPDPDADPNPEKTGSDIQSKNNSEPDPT